ncbi:hypothetical protein RUM43_008738 [Polyplax serrata]|uniref:Uncharacterized protein n=1 Tax=Polyplax serrata TaxID=468196 RepID=A0AAN8NUT5_POLSC
MDVLYRTEEPGRTVHSTGEGGGLSSVARFGADEIESLSETSVTGLSVQLELFLSPSSCHIQYKNEVSDIFKNITVIISVVLVRIYINLVCKSVQHGAPQVLRHAGTREVLAVRGEEALLRLIVCADPRPKRAIWEWGSEFVEAGKPNGRYQAELIDDEREDCYEARLHVQDVEPSDSRSYYLAVENEKGTDRHAVHLTVREPMWTTTLLSMMHHEPVPMTTLISIAAGCLVIFLFCVFVAIYVVRREKCCFARRGDFRPTDLESEKSDLNSEIGRKQQPSVIVGTGPVTAPTDAMYNPSPGRRPHMITAHVGGSPEAMKVRLAAMVLQPPTRV